MSSPLQTPLLVLHAAPLPMDGAPTPDLLGEGPIYDHRDGTLSWVDILGCAVSTFNVRSGEYRRVKVGTGDEACGFALPISSSPSLLLCGSQYGLFLLDKRSGRVVQRLMSAMPEREAKCGTAGLRFNDGKADPCGNLVAGTMMKKPHRTFVRPHGSGGLFAFRFDSAEEDTVSYRCISDTARIPFPVTISNGMAWSPPPRVDGRGGQRTLYFVDSQECAVFAMPYDADTCAIVGERRVLYDTRKSRWPSSRPDGCCIDSEGMLWVALIGGGVVVRIDARSGKELAVVQLPDGVSQVTSCCFGPLSTLYITTAVATTLDDVEEKVRSGTVPPLAGHLFCCDVSAAFSDAATAGGVATDFVSVPMPRRSKL
jgi:sugar lactone lactonase YvrE